MRHLNFLFPGVPALVLLLILPLVVPASAYSMPQVTPPDTIVTGGNRVVIVVDDDGKVIVHRDDTVNLDGTNVYVVDPDEIARKARVFSSRRPELQFFDNAKIMEYMPRLDAMREHFEFAPDGPMILDFMGGGFAEERVEIDKMEQEVRSLAHRARSAEGGEKAEIESEMREKLQTLFDMKVALEEKEAERLEERLQKKNQRLEERRSARNEIVDRRLSELLGEETIYDW